MNTKGWSWLKGLWPRDGGAEFIAQWDAIPSTMYRREIESEEWGDIPLPAIARMLRTQKVSAKDLVARAEHYHERYGSKLNAYHTWAPRTAQAQARAADAAFKANCDTGPLQGIPVSVKDLFGVMGLPTYAGTPTRLPNEWEAEGPIIKAVRQQLGVITGKTHMVELAFGGLGLNNTWSTPRNPWDAEHHRVSGGSSSGAGVSLCEGSAMVALGSDTAGSVRIPASMTATVGLKTTLGRWSTDGMVPLSWTLDTPGVLAKSVLDVAWAFAAIDADCDSATLGAIKARAESPGKLTIGVGDATQWSDCDRNIADTVREALGVLERNGIKVVDQPVPEATSAIDLLHAGSVAAAECDAFLSESLPAWREKLDPIVSARLADGGDITAREYIKRTRELKLLSAGATSRFDSCDAIASPTVAISPPTVAELGDIDVYRRLNMLALRNTCVASFLGLCAISIPVGLDAKGLPVGLQLMARAGQEIDLLGIALACEMILGTSRERLGRPPMCS